MKKEKKNLVVDGFLRLRPVIQTLQLFTAVYIIPLYLSAYIKRKIEIVCKMHLSFANIKPLSLCFSLGMCVCVCIVFDTIAKNVEAKVKETEMRAKLLIYNQPC